MPSPRQKKASLGCAWVVAATISTGTGAFLAPPSSRGCCSRRSSSIQVQRVGSPRHTSPWSSRGVSRVSTRLNGVKEWKATQPGGEGGTREIGFLPFPVEDVMCPGETKALHLYEARFLALFENAIREHGGCVGGAIFVDDGVLVRVGQLCDIVAWEREEVGVSVALRCVGRVEITDVTGIDPYITATVREVRDSVGEAPEGGEEESNDVVSSDVFSLHRQCAEIEAKMAAVSGVGWEGGASGGGSGPSAGAGPNRGDTGTRDDSWVSSSPTSSRTRRVEAAESLGFFGIDEEEGDGEEEEEENDDQGEERGGNGGDDRYRSRYSEDLFGENGESSSATASEEGLTGAGDGDDLMSRFQRGGGELDLSQLGAGWASGLDAGGRGSAAGEDGGGGVGGGVVGGNGIDTFGGEMFVDLGDDEEEDEDEDDEEEEGQGERGLEDLLWGHESWAGDGFDVSLEEQVEAMNDSLQADLMVSLDEKRGGLDAASFGSPFAPNGNSGSSSSSSSSSGSSKDSDGSGQSPGEGQGPWGGVRTIAELIAASASLESGEGTEGGEGGGGSGTDGRGEGSGEAFLWGCSSRQEERNQLVSFVSLGCFDPSARLQSLIITSTGDRLRMARDALAERLKVLVAKSALSQLGD